jgi:hypothetical protein
MGNRSRVSDLDVDPWKELQKKLRRVAVYAIEKAVVTDALTFDRLARECFKTILDRTRGDWEEGSPGYEESEIF